MPSGPSPAAPADAAGPDPARRAFALSAIHRSVGALDILSDVTLAARPGERIALIGPSGAGKTTLLRVLNTTLEPGEGRVEILGTDPARLGAGALRRLRGRIGTVYQQLHLVPQASVIENVLMGRLATRSAWHLALATLRRRDREEVAAVLAGVGLLPRIDERVDRLSGGEQQRVAIARVLYQSPDLLLADEPFASVDPARAREVVQLLLTAARGRTLVVSTHQLEPVLPHFPRVVGLRAGRIVFDRPRSEVTPDDLARLYQPEGATPSPEPRRMFAAARAAAHAEVLVGASTTPGEYLLPRVLVPFRREHPDLQVRLTVKGTEEVVRRLVAGEVEIALVGARSSDPELHFEDLAEDEIVLVASPRLEPLPRAPLSAEELAALPRVEREPGSATREVVERQLAAMGMPLEPSSVVLEAGSVAALKQAVLAGIGVGFASRLSVAEELATGALVALRLRDVEIPRRYFVAWRRDAPPGPAARWLIEAARQAVRSRSAA